MKRKEILKKAGIICFWFVLWQVISYLIGNPILVAGPIEVGQTLLTQVRNQDFWLVVFLSFARITGGFLLAFVSGFLLGIIAYHVELLREILQPIMAMLKSVPIASFAVLLLIWMGSSHLTIWVSFLVVFPGIYHNTMTGMEQTNFELLEMAKVFQVSKWMQIRFLYLKSVIPYLKSGIKTVAGMSFKSGVAAEIIGTPNFSLGEKIYMAKIYLDTAGVFAWTIIVVILSNLFEKSALHFLEILDKKAFKVLDSKSVITRNVRLSKNAGQTEYKTEMIRFQNLTKQFDDRMVIQGVSYTVKNGDVVCVMSPSGTGKTTLFRMILGLEKSTEGTVFVDSKIGIAAVFQKECLCEYMDAVSNVMLISNLEQSEVENELCKLLPSESLKIPVAQLSGGMKRRVSIVRAMVASADLIIMDEPFTGLDSATKKMVAAYIIENRRGRTLLFSTHHEEERVLLGGERWILG